MDAARYQLPSEKYLTGLVSKAPGDFCFAFKVTDDITLKRFSLKLRGRSGNRGVDFRSAAGDRTFPRHRLDRV